jgi:hypothetical protein
MTALSFSAPELFIRTPDQEPWALPFTAWTCLLHQRTKRPGSLGIRHQDRPEAFSPGNRWDSLQVHHREDETHFNKNARWFLATGVTRNPVYAVMKRL